MSIALPLPISSYFDAKNAHDVDAMLATFASDALVHDEKRDFVGRVAIPESIGSRPLRPASSKPAKRPS
jgi:hypothetical protein